MELVSAGREIRGKSVMNLHISNTAEGEDRTLGMLVLPNIGKNTGRTSTFESVVVGQCWVSHAVRQFAVDEARAEGCLKACTFVSGYKNLAID